MQTLSKAVAVFSRFSKIVALVITALVIVLVIIDALSLSLLAGTGKIDAKRDMFLYLFSVNILPLLLGYLVIMAFLYYLFRMTRSRILQANEAEVATARKEATITTLQKMTGMVAERLVVPNSELQRYIAVKKRKGQAPLALEIASRRISETVQQLTWMSYVLPHAKSNGNSDAIIDGFSREPASEPRNDAPALIGESPSKRR